MNLNDHRPARIEFDVALDNSPMPQSFGEFKTAEEATKAIKMLTAINQAVTVNRHLDVFEKSEMRKEVTDLLENILPRHEKDWSIAAQELAEAKKKEKAATEAVEFVTNQAKEIARGVKRGTKEIKLDDLFTYRIPYKGRYYFYTYIDKELKLCRISDIPEHEKTEIFNAMSMNDKVIDDTFGDTDEQK